MIDRQTVERIFDAAHIVDVVGDFIALRKSGSDYVGLCPFHADTNPSFRVSPSKNICKCFVCGEGGTAVNFVMKHENITYVEALRWLAKKYGISLKERELTDEEKRLGSDRESMLIVNSWAQRFFTSRLYEHEEGRAVGLTYFYERGFREEIIRKFQLGYGLMQRDDLYKSALGQGYKEEYLLKTGLCTKYDDGRVMDFFHGRVIFPIHTLSGKIVAFGGRILREGYSKAKYKNSRESELYNKSYELYGLYLAKQAIQKADKCYLVEGYTDVISMHQSGVENVVAACGTSLTGGHLRLIQRFTKNITLLNDGDAAGIRASMKDVDKCFEEGMNVKIVVLPEGEDPDSFARKHNSFDLNLYIKEHETDFIVFKTKLLLQEADKDPFKRSELVREILETVSKIRDNITRSVYITECSQLLNVRERELVDMVGVIMERNSRVPRRGESGGGVGAVGTEGTVGTNGTGGTGGTGGAVGTGGTDGAGETDGAGGTLVSGEVSVRLQRVKVNSLKPFEALLLNYVVKYGELALYSEPEIIHVAEYIYNELSADAMLFETQLYEEMLEQAVKMCGREEFIAERYFLTHSDVEINKLAADMLSSRYKMSRRFETTEQEGLSEEEKQKREERCKMKWQHQLRRMIVHDIYLLKNEHLKLEIARLNGEILSLGDDFERSSELIARRLQLEAIVRELSKKLGERVITGV